MACLDQHLNDPEYANWVKNTLALKITLDVLKPYVIKELEAFQTSIIEKGPPGVECSLCNVSAAPSCPKNVCNVYKKEITDNHRSADPSFRNTNAKKWKTDVWEIAKCFMPPIAGYKNCVQSDADFSGVINIIINCHHFDALVLCDLNQDGNMFNEARSMRNMLMHSDTLKMSESDVQRNLDLLISLLRCFNDTPKNSPEAGEQIKKLKTGGLQITMDDILDLRKQAILAVLEEFKKENQELREFVDLCTAQLRQGLDTTTSFLIAPHCRLLSNFIKGCKHSLIRLVESEFESLKPKRCPPHQWNFEEFLKRIELSPDIRYLLDRHNRLLYPEDGSESDITKWDIFLLCHILYIETRDELPNHLVNYLRELKAMRDKILDDPDSIREEDLKILNGYLDEPLRTEVAHIYAGECITDDAVQLQLVLKSWQLNEDNRNSIRVPLKELELGKEVLREIEDLNNRVDMLEKGKQHDQDERKRNTEDEVEPMTAENPKQNDQIYEDCRMFGESGSMASQNEDMIETCVLVEPKNCDPEEEKQIQENITSKDSDKNISISYGGLNHFKKQKNLETVYIVEGSIILKVTCKSIKELIRYWDSCMDGSAVRAFCKIRDDYREFLGCSTLDFDLVLTKKEVHRCINHLVDRLSSRLLDKRIVKENQVKVSRLQTVSAREEDLTEESINLSLDEAQHISQPPDVTNYAKISRQADRVNRGIPSVRLADNVGMDSDAPRHKGKMVAKIQQLMNTLRRQKKKRTTEHFLYGHEALEGSLTNVDSGLGQEDFLQKLQEKDKREAEYRTSYPDSLSDDDSIYYEERNRNFHRVGRSRDRGAISSSLYGVSASRYSERPSGPYYNVLNYFPRQRLLARSARHSPRHEGKIAAKIQQPNILRRQKKKPTTEHFLYGHEALEGSLTSVDSGLDQEDFLQKKDKREAEYRTSYPGSLTSVDSGLDQEDFLQELQENDKRKAEYRTSYPDSLSDDDSIYYEEGNRNFHRVGRSRARGAISSSLYGVNASRYSERPSGPYYKVVNYFPRQRLLAQSARHSPRHEGKIAAKIQQPMNTLRRRTTEYFVHGHEALENSPSYDESIYDEEAIRNFHRGDRSPDSGTSSSSSISDVTESSRHSERPRSPPKHERKIAAKTQQPMDTLRRRTTEYFVHGHEALERRKTHMDSTLDEMERKRIKEKLNRELLGLKTRLITGPFLHGHEARKRRNTYMNPTLVDVERKTVKEKQKGELPLQETLKGEDTKLGTDGEIVEDTTAI